MKLKVVLNLQIILTDDAGCDILDIISENGLIMYQSNLAVPIPPVVIG